jgi:hypothetical protein
VASDHPRILPDRHQDECGDEACGGCLACPSPHCRVCGVEHSVGACAECVGEVRDDLAEILEMYAELPTEAETRGVNGEAAALLGPSADPEAWGHVSASIASGRIAADWRLLPKDQPKRADGTPKPLDDERHPLWVFGTWAMVYREAFDHDEPLSRATVDSEGGYLARNLSYMGNFEYVPFEEFARDLRICSGHLKAVRHDRDNGERANVSCFDCNGDLERMLGPKGFDDQWTCRSRGCRRKYTIAEYNFALRAKLEESACDAT